MENQNTPQTENEVSMDAAQVNEASVESTEAQEPTEQLNEPEAQAPEQAENAEETVIPDVPMDGEQTPLEPVDNTISATVQASNEDETPVEMVQEDVKVKQYRVRPLTGDAFSTVDEANILLYPPSDYEIQIVE